MKRFKQLLKEENGSTTILLVGILFFGVVLIVLFMNFAKIFAVADRGSSAAEQASLAASDVVYDQIMEDVIEDYSYVCGFDGDADIICYLEDDYLVKRASLDDGTLSAGELKKRAIDEVLIEKIPGRNDLKRDIRQALNTAKNEIRATVRNVINANKGEAAGSKIILFNDKNRIEVRSKATFESIDTEVIPSIEEDIGKIGMGVEIPFIDYISWSSDSITLH
ncbi:hypothetical protein D8M04_04675 [Oceanobacillus piezotolerans]|uniref:Uncharacterized protein n=1 Tax=Oceanobacillus piezotolerans TaxID=2448030 RepID=A0A498D7K5_9BACI|nr:Tad domain-containing protein [Oceanobacillus piezotolerans]RLL46506.1 hypothetical protein D8M04_04675 [Oceanobacillus piezotolerans]